MAGFDVALWWLLAYLIGSVPFGYVLCRAFGYGDIRTIGSGNIGATNVLRTGNKPLALATFLLDTGKGALAVALLAARSGQDWVLWGAGLAAILGHLFPIWLKFKGGKGVATSIGTLLALNIWVGVAVCVVWLGVAYALRISSLSALSAFALMPAFALVFVSFKAVLPAMMISALIFARHRANIERLVQGQEPKMSFGKKTDQP